MSATDDELPSSRGSRRARLAPRIPFPPYRYVPGVNPHPLRSPVGHLRDRESRPHPSDTDEAMRYGIDLYHAAYYWEAHEVWEDLWRQMRGVERDVLQSLIQLAAGDLKRELGAARSARQLYTSALARLPTAGVTTVLRVSIARLRCALEGGLSAVESQPGPPEALTSDSDPV